MPMKALAYINAQPWAILPESLETIIAVVAREQSDTELAASIRSARQGKLDAILADRGAPLAGSESVTVRDGVAIVPVTGPISRYASYFTDVSGGATIDGLTRDFAAALNAPSVKAIMLHVDSPGGEITGVAQLAQQIYAARQRKPVVAYVEGLGASAAYWLASAASEVVLDPTALVGSIGVVQSMRNPDASGKAVIEIVSSQSPKKRVNPNTESGRATIQATIDELASLFIDAVATHRGVTADKVAADFGQGGVLVGQSAVAAGMADRVDTIENTIQRLSSAAPKTGGSTMDWKGFFSGMFAAAEDAGATSEDLKPAPLEAKLDTTASAEAEALRQRVAALEAEKAAAAVAQLDTDAKAYADNLVAAQKLAPAAAGSVEALYKVAAQSGTLEHVKAAFGALPVAKIAGERTADIRAVPLDRNPAADDDAQIARQVAAYHKTQGGK